MEINEMLEYAHGFVLKSSEGLAENGRTEEPACGVWTVRDVIGHLCSFKHYVAEVISTFTGNTDTPYFNLMAELRGDFGDSQVAARKDISFEDNLAEYNAEHARMMTLLAQVPDEELHRPGTLPWYGAQYALDDFILYTDFGHQIEHASQLAVVQSKQPAAQVSGMA